MDYIEYALLKNIKGFFLMNYSYTGYIKAFKHSGFICNFIMAELIVFYSYYCWCFCDLVEYFSQAIKCDFKIIRNKNLLQRFETI